MNDEELSLLIKRDAERHTASARLRAAVQTQITLHTVGQKPCLTERFDGLGRIRSWLGSTDTGTPVGARRNSTLQLSLGFVCGVLLTLALVLLMPRMLPLGATSDVAVAELVSLHVRSMGAVPMFQVASSDRHTVKPWFQGKLDYAPEVPDLHDAGFDLLGGRVDKLHGRETAALAYQFRKHFISAYVLPMDQVSPIKRMQAKGFNIIHWSDGAMQIWAVTDLDASELERFGITWRSRVAERLTNEGM